MSVNIDGPKCAGWDAADALAEGWTTQDVIAWAKARARVWPDFPGNEPEGAGEGAQHGADASEGDAIPPSDSPAPSDPPSDLQPPPDDEPPVDANWPFRVLGYNREHFYFLSKEGKQISTFRAEDLERSGKLARLAPLPFWEVNWPSKQGAEWKAICSDLIRACYKAGIYTSHNRIRGRGAWIDEGRSIFHGGDLLIEDGETRTDVTSIKSRFVYERDDSLHITPTPAIPAKEAIKLLEVCKSLRWDHPMSAHLLAGWIVIAPLCGILNWRPHLWITGPAGSGKTTVMRDVVSRIVGRYSAKVVGMTTEAALRGLLKYDARPVIFDEAEPKDNHNQARIRAIIDLARVAASEADGMVYKGTRDQGVNGYPIRSMFCFGSINPGLESYADESRFTQLALVKNEPVDEEERAMNQANYDALTKRMAETFTDAFVDGLLFRTLDNLVTLRANVDTFTTAAASVLGNRRLGDQIGPLLAGAHLLHKSERVSYEDALAWVKGREWTEHSARGVMRDSDRLLQLLMQQPVRFGAGNSGQTERSIGELVDAAVRVDSETAINQTYAQEALLRCGFRVDARGLTIAANHLWIRNALARTEWAMGWRRALLAVDGAKAANGGKNVRFGPGVSTTGVWIPLNVVMGD